MECGYEFEVAQKPRIEAPRVQMCIIVVNLSAVILTFHEGMQNEIVLQPGMNTINPLTPNDSYSGRTAPLTSKRYILYIYSTNTGTEYFKHSINSPFFSLQNAVVS